MINKDVVLITGGAGNIAQAVINKYLENDCIVIATDIKEDCSNKQFTNNINYDYYKCDVTNVENIKQLKQKIEEKYGKITHLISMAGDSIGSDIKGIEYVTIEDIDKTIKLNLSSHIYITTVLLPLLKNNDNNKTITYISSINALRAYDVPVYSAAKASLYGLMRGMLQDLGKLNIRVNIMSPGTILRPWEIEEAKQTNGESLKGRPQTKYGEFAVNTDIADTIFCITHIMKKMVGQDIVIDAGQMA